MHRACVLTPRCRPHHQAARSSQEHTTQLPSPAVCLMRWPPRRGKYPILFRGGRSPPRLLERKKQDESWSPAARRVVKSPFLHLDHLSPPPSPSPIPTYPDLSRLPPQQLFLSERRRLL